MINSHTILAIVQTALYVPAVPLAIYLVIRNGSTLPTMAWRSFIPFTLIRLVGGAITIAYEQKPTNVSLATAALVLLNVGAIPLIIVNFGLLRIILMDNFKQDRRSSLATKPIRFGLIAAIVLLVAGGSLSASHLHLSRLLTLVGYIVFAVILVVLLALQFFFWTQRHTLVPSSRLVLTGVLIAAPFIIVRNVYGILYVLSDADLHSVWNPLYGSTVAFGTMALLSEYIAMCVYFFVGFSIVGGRGGG